MQPSALLGGKTRVIRVIRPCPSRTSKYCFPFLLQILRLVYRTRIGLHIQLHCINLTYCTLLLRANLTSQWNLSVGIVATIIRCADLRTSRTISRHLSTIRPKPFLQLSLKPQDLPYCPHASPITNTCTSIWP